MTREATARHSYAWLWYNNSVANPTEALDPLGFQRRCEYVSHGWFARGCEILLTFLCVLNSRTNLPPGWKPRLYVSQDGRRYNSQTGSAVASAGVTSRRAVRPASQVSIKSTASVATMNQRHSFWRPSNSAV